jgi:hypothetical protein
MASSGWADLWGAPSAAHDGADSRAALLRLQAELFVAAPARDRETIRIFEAMALGFAPRVDTATLTAVARLVSPCADTPGAILETLAERAQETRALIVMQAPHLPQPVIDLALACPKERPLLAARPDLEEHTVHRLLALADGESDEALAANGRLRCWAAAYVLLLERAREQPALARILLARQDLTWVDEASLYLAADANTRARIRSRIASSALLRRRQLPFRVDERFLQSLLAAAFTGDIERFEAYLTEAFGQRPDTRWRVLEPDRQELLALALRALGVLEEDATRIFLTIHPALSHSVARVFALVRTMREVARQTALALTEAIIGATSEFDRPGRHQPAFDPSGTPARGGRNLTDHERRAAEERPGQAGRSL